MVPSTTAITDFQMVVASVNSVNVHHIIDTVLFNRNSRLSHQIGLLDTLPLTLSQSKHLGGSPVGPPVVYSMAVMDLRGE